MPPDIQKTAEDKLVPDPQVLARYSISHMTLYRWDKRPDLGFPKPIKIAGRKYRYLSELISWERSQAAGRAA